MEAGTLVEWLVKPGDHVERGDILAVVETQKGAIEIEVFDSGEIEEILVGLNAKVPVGTPLALIRTRAEPIAAAVPPSPAPVAAAPAGSVAVQLPPVPEPRKVVRPHASPAARRLAQSRNLDLSQLAGSGPAGAILYADVARAFEAAAPPSERKAKGLDLDAMRTAIAAAMARAKREIPHYYLMHQVDVSGCEAWLARVNASREPEARLLFGALAIKAVAKAARQFPFFNGFYHDGAFEPAGAVHVGVAIAIRGGGLAAPALHNVDELPLDRLMAHLRDLVQRMRTGRIRASEIADPTITVSSLGDRGVEALYGIVYPPQVALVGFGKVVVRPWVVAGVVEPRSIITITLAADHRVSDGHAGGLFLSAIGNLLQEPGAL